MVTRRQVWSFLCAASWIILSLPLYSQNRPPARGSPAEACEGLNGVARNVKSIASNLKVCSDLEFIIRARSNSGQPAARGEGEQRPPVGQLREEFINPEESQRSELEAHQGITERVAQAALHSNIVEAQIHTVLLQMQASAWNAEQKAYQRTKIPNAFLGTSLGAVGPVFSSATA